MGGGDMNKNQQPTEEQKKAAQVLADFNIHHQTPETVAKAQQALSAKSAKEKE